MSWPWWSTVMPSGLSRSPRYVTGLSFSSSLTMRLACDSEKIRPTFGSHSGSSELVSPLTTTSGIVPPAMTPGISGAICSSTVLGQLCARAEEALRPAASARVNVTSVRRIMATAPSLVETATHYRAGQGRATPGPGEITPRPGPSLRRDEIPRLFLYLDRQVAIEKARRETKHRLDLFCARYSAPYPYSRKPAAHQCVCTVRRLPWFLSP